MVSVVALGEFSGIVHDQERHGDIGRVKEPALHLRMGLWPQHRSQMFI